MRTKYYNHAQEEGSVMIIGGMGLIIAIMIMALLMDMGMYYNSYRRLKAVSDFANEEVTQMLPYYAYSGDYVEAFNRSLDAALDGHGYTSSNVKKSEIDRNTSLNMSWTVIVSTDIILEDESYCMFASIIGINKIPIRVSAKSRQPMSIGEPYYDGQPYEVWGEDGADP